MIPMAPDYKKLGFKCGIEIHQRLASHGKLFCACAASGDAAESDGSFTRRQRAVAGELGKVDAAAAAEQVRGRVFKYLAYPASSCEVEADDEPPHKLNAEALDIALQIALLLACNVVDEAQVMRKAVLDGSNTSGFQRTALLATGGTLPTPAGNVGIGTLAIEEEACSILGEEANGEIAYGLDRLGIPLVEVATEPDIVSPEHCREVAEKLGLLMRATGKVQRGIGTIRQDVNVSIADGARVEIKGVQELGAIPKIVENEVLRQVGLVAIIAELKKRGAKEWKLDAVDVSKALSGTESRMLRKCLDRQEVLLAFRAPKFAGLLGKELFEGRRLGSELSDYAKTAGVGGIIHSDEKLDTYPISEKETAAIAKAVGAKEGDAWVLVAGPKGRADAAVTAAHGRALAALSAVPNETRKVVNETGSAYMRPLPGGARLYPETDLPTVRITRDRLSRLAAVLPETPEAQLAKLKKVLNDELANKMFRSQRLPVFQRIITDVPAADAMLVAGTLEETLVSLKREGVAVEKVGEEKLVELFMEYAKGSFVKAAIPEILRKLAEKPDASVKNIVGANSLSKMTHKEIESLVKTEMKECADGGRLMKRVMERCRLRAEGGDVAKVVASLSR